MTLNQLTSYAFIILVVVVAISEGVSTALDFYIKKMTADGKKVPAQVVSAKEASDALYSEANKLLDYTGAEKKEWATDKLMEQKPSLTKAVASGMIQKSYDDANKTSSSTDDGASQLPFNDDTDTTQDQDQDA